MVGTVNILSLAVLLTIMQTVPPVTRKASDTTASRGDAVKKDSGSKQTQSVPTTIPDPSSPKRDDDPSRDLSKSNQKDSITVTKFPAVSVSKDWWDRWTVMLTGCLVLVGAIGTRFALRTLRAIEAQTAAVQYQARVSRLSLTAARLAVRKASAGVRAAIESNKLTTRSIMLANPPKISARAVHLHGGALNAGQTADGELTIINRGKTAAIIERLWIDAMWGLPATPLPYDQLAKTVHISLDPGESNICKFTSSQGGIAQGFVDSFNTGNRDNLYVVIFLVYRYGDPMIKKRILLCYQLRRVTGRFRRVTHPDLHRGKD